MDLERVEGIDIEKVGELQQAELVSGTLATRLEVVWAGRLFFVDESCSNWKGKFLFSELTLDFSLVTKTLNLLPVSRGSLSLSSSFLTSTETLTGKVVTVVSVVSVVSVSVSVSVFSVFSLILQLNEFSNSGEGLEKKFVLSGTKLWAGKSFNGVCSILEAGVETENEAAKELLIIIEGLKGGVISLYWDEDGLGETFEKFSSVLIGVDVLELWLVEIAFLSTDKFELTVVVVVSFLKCCE